MNQKLFKNLSLSLISLVIFFTLAEAATRFFWNPEYDKPREGVIMEGRSRSIIQEGVLYKTNSFGLRNKELSLNKDSNTVRILALGDSFVWGDGLSEEELITVKIEELLNSKYKKKIEVINAGINHYNTKNEYEQLMRLYPIYQPDLIILFFYTNDVLATDSLNHIPTWNLERVNHFLRLNSRFYSFLYSHIKKFQSSNFEAPAFLLHSDYFDLDDSKPGWLNFKKYLYKIKSFCEEQNTEQLFVIIPTLTNLDSNYPYIELQEKVKLYVNSTNIRLYDLFPLFSNYAAKDLWVSDQNRHWNGKATSLAADRLSNFIIVNRMLAN